MQNSDILKIYFFDNIKNGLENFESSTLRKNLKASLELNDFHYLTNAIDERIKTVAYINFNDVNKFNYFKGKDFKKISFAFYSESEGDTKLLSINKGSEPNYVLKDNQIKILSQYDLIFVPSIVAKEILQANNVATNIEVLLPPIKKTKFDIRDSEISKLVYIYFHIEENSNYVYIILDGKDEEAAKKVVEFAKIFSQLKIIVIVPGLNKKEAKPVRKYFKRWGQNVYITPVLSEDIYTSLVYNANAFLLFNTLYNSSIALLESYICGVPVFSLKTSAFKDILIDKENSYVYNDFESLIDGFNSFLAGNLPSLKENQKAFMKANDIKSIGRKFIKHYKEYFGD